MTDTRPPVAPVEGHYAMLRDGSVCGPIKNASIWYPISTDKWGCWVTDFLWDDSGQLAGKVHFSDRDIIAIITPEAMQAAATGEVERLRAALAEIFEMWAGSEGFIPETAPEGYLLELIKKMAMRALEVPDAD